MNPIPLKIEVVALIEKKPAKGILVKLLLLTKNKNDYSFIIGPTNSDGKASIEYNEIIDEANKTLELALMDYVSLSENYTGEFKTEVMNKTDIESAINAYEIYGAENYPEQYINNLKLALSNKINISEVKLSVANI